MHVDLINDEYVSWRDFLSEADVWDAKAIENYQLDEVSAICEHAYCNTRGYRELFDEVGFKSSRMRSFDEFRKLPSVSKELIRERLEDFSTADPDRSHVTTGGSTGIPFGFYRNSIAFSRELASKAHQYSRIGWEEGDRQLVFRGIPIDAADHMHYLADFEELRCSSYHLREENMRGYYDAAVEYRPKWIRCYPSTGVIFADFLLANQLRLNGVKGVLCASENLYDWQKDKLRLAFGGRVFSHYGHYELAVLAGYCEHRDTYHVLPQYGYAELIGSDGELVSQPGCMGEIVATSFLMTNTPFIRYRTRDFAVLDGWGCEACHRPYQVWRRIEGRLQEFIVTGDGRYISMTAINMHDKTFEPIQQFQFVQERPGAVSFRYVPKRGCNSSALSDMVARLRIKLGADMEIDLEPTDCIEMTGRGKHRFLVQRLQLKYGE